MYNKNDTNIKLLLIVYDHLIPYLLYIYISHVCNCLINDSNLLISSFSNIIMYINIYKFILLSISYANWGMVYSIE